MKFSYSTLLLKGRRELRRLDSRLQDFHVLETLVDEMRDVEEATQESIDAMLACVDHGT